MNGLRGHVKVHGEIWEAFSDDTLQKGDKAKIIGMEDMRLHVQKELPSSKQPEPKKEKPG